MNMHPKPTAAAIEGDIMTIGDRVTTEAPYYSAGHPVADWPHPEYVGTLTEIFKNRGLTYGKVKYGKDHRNRNIYKLHLVESLTVV